MLLRKNTEIRSQIHLMDAEGTSDSKPIKLDVKELIKQEGWIASNIEIFYDNMQGFWRWNCKIKKL